jgi:hypothetical protein
LPPPYVLQTREQEEPVTNKETEETGNNDYTEAESITPHPNSRRKLEQCKKYR